MAQDSFALPEQRPVFSQETAQPLVPQTGLVGGNLSGGLQLRDPSKDAPGILDHLFAFAVKVGDKKIAEYEAAEKDRRFLAGIGRAAAGEAARDIAEEQPWWARMFGDGNEVAGARAWEGIADANHMEASVMERMRDLRSLPPEKAQAALLEIHRDMRSGDPTRDAAQAALWVRALPGILKQHAKEHLAYKQEVATEAQRKGIQSAFDSFDAKAKAFSSLDNRDGADMDGATETLKSVFTPPAGVNPATYRAQLVEGLANSLAAGKFAAYSAANRAGLLSSLPAAQARQLDALHDREARKVAFDRAPPYLQDRLLAVGTLPAEEAAAELDAINKEFMAVSGLDIPLVPSSQQQTMLMRAAARDEAEAARKLAAAEKAAEKEAERQAKVALEQAKLGSAIAAQQAERAAADALVDGMLSHPSPSSIPVAESFNAGNPVFKLAKERLPLEVARRWDEPPVNMAAITALPEAQRATALAAAQAEARWQLLRKEGAPMQAVRANIGEALATGSYDAAAGVIDALAFGADGSGMKKLPDNLVRLVPEQYRPLMAAYAEELGAAKVDPKTGMADRGAAWAAAEARVRLTARKPPAAADMKSIRAALKEERGWFQGNTQAEELTAAVAGRLYDGRVSSGGLSPVGVAIAAAREQVVTLADSGMAYLHNPQASEPIEGYTTGGQYRPSKYLQHMKPADRAGLSTPDRFGRALKEAVAAQGIDPTAAPLIYRADDTPQGLPSFIVLGSIPGRVSVITLDDLLAASRRLNTKDRGQISDGSDLNIAP